MNKEELYIKQLEPYFPGEQRVILDKLIEHATYLYKSLYRYSGESYLLRTLRLATEKILKLRPDQATIIATVLISACYSPRCDLDKIQQLFGVEVRSLVESLGKINAIKSRYSSSDTKVISNMFLTLSHDIRVIIIRLADRIENMETLQFKSLDKQKANAREILDVYVPIASRLGLYEYKLILEDLAFKYVFPQEYKMLKKELDEYLSYSEQTIEETKHELENLMKKNGFDVIVSGRIKNLFSIFKKLKKKTATLDQIYDIYAMRVVLKNGSEDLDSKSDIEKLYKMLSILHSEYDNLPERFKDYLANPKQNGYRSLHIALVGLNSVDIKRPTEVQIRTEKMHAFAENGHAAHWIYKESQHTPHDSDLSKALSDLKKNFGSIDPSTALLKMNLYQDRIFVLTPENLVKELPIGSTPIDFAYAIHSEIGHSYYLAKVNGNVVPLDYKLKSGDIVEIVRSPKINTKLSWLEFVKTKLARNRIKNYFRTLDKDSLLEQGKTELNQLLDKLKMPRLEESLGFLKNYKGRNISLKARQDLLEEVGAGVISPSNVFKNAYGKSPESILAPERARPVSKRLAILPKRDLSKSVSNGGAYLLIGGEKNIPFRLSSCCKPKLTENIVAYMTKNKGVSVHKVNCNFVINADSSRILTAKFETSESSENTSRYHVSLLLELRESRQQLKAIVDYFTLNKITILSFSTVNREGDSVYRKIIIDILDDFQLENIIANLGLISGVLKVSRM